MRPGRFPRTASEQARRSIPGTRTLLAVLLAVSLMISHPAAFAEKSGKIIVPFPVGGAMDKTARSVAGALSERTPWRFSVENRPGADGLIAVDGALQDAGGDPVLLMVNPYFTTAMANGRLPAAKAARLRALINVGELDILLIASRQSGLKQITDLTPNPARARPLGCAAASGQFTTICDRLARDYPGTVTSVPYKGEAQALQDLLGDHIDLMPVTRISAVPHVDAGTIVLLANLSSPSVPRSSEVPYVFRMPIRSFMGLVVPDAMPEPIRRLLNRELNRLLETAEFQQALSLAGLRGVGGTSEDFDQFLRGNVETQVRLLKGRP